MHKPLTIEQQVWVDNTLGQMTLEECVGHLLMPADDGRPVEDWLAVQRDVPLGALWVDGRDRGRIEAVVDALQSHARVPLAVAADLEAGVGGTGFPWGMALGAAGDAALAQAMARAAAREARALGVQWVFQPAADILYEFRNPEIGARALGDKPARVRGLAAALVRGLQEDGLLAATAAHFPGAGADDRDSRVCTTLNPFATGKWRRTYGSVWRSLIDADVMAAMTGHIAFPDYEGLADRPAEALPATLSARVQVELLRRELGFTGVIVSDEASKGGMASRVPADEQALQFILTGGDVYRFADLRRDFTLLMQAVRAGRLNETRVRESARRVLELKARVGLFRGQRSATPTAGDLAEHQSLAEDIAGRGAVVWKNDGAVPTRLPSGARVLTVTVRAASAAASAEPELGAVDDELRRRGLEVTHWLNPDGDALASAAARYDLVCINVLGPAALPRATPTMAAAWGRGFWLGRRNVVFTVFGLPFVVYEAPQWPNAVLTFSPCEAAQRAAVRIWFGEIEARGVLPVKLPRF